MLTSDSRTKLKVAAVVAAVALTAVACSHMEAVPPMGPQSVGQRPGKLVHPVSVPKTINVERISYAVPLPPQPLHVVARPAAATFPGVPTYRYTLSRGQTNWLKIIAFSYGNRADALIAGVAGGVCALLFIEGTPVAAAVGAIGCATFVAFYWGAIVDALQTLTPARACLRVTDHFLTMFGVSWFSFSRGKCFR